MSESHTSDLQGATPAPGIGGVISAVQRQRGELLTVDHRTGMATISWRLPKRCRGRYAMRHTLRAETRDVRVTDGVTGDSWRLIEGDQFPINSPEVEFTLSQDVLLPPPGAQLVLPSELHAIEVSAPEEVPLLVLARGRLDTWTNVGRNGRPAAYGFITAFGRDGSKMRVFVRYDSLLDSDRLPHTADVTPVLGQPVHFTARASSRRNDKKPEAHAVTAPNGGAILVRQPSPARDDDDAMHA